MKTPMPSTEFSSTITPSTTSERAPMKQLSSMIVGLGLQRLEHAADADAAGQMHVLADLRAGADRGPGVDHRAFVDIRADVARTTASARRCARTYAPRRATAGGTTRTPAAAKSASEYCANLVFTLS